MIETTPSLQQVALQARLAHAAITLARREAEKAVEMALKRQGKKPQYIARREIVALAKEYLAAHPELVAPHWDQGLRLARIGPVLESWRSSRSFCLPDPICARRQGSYEPDQRSEAEFAEPGERLTRLRGNATHDFARWSSNTECRSGLSPHRHDVRLRVDDARHDRRELLKRDPFLVNILVPIIDLADAWKDVPKALLGNVRRDPCPAH